MRISELYQAIERDYQMNRKRSIRNIRMCWKLHLEPFFGERDAEELTTDEVETYIVMRQSAGASNGTINRETAVLKRMYKLAMRARKVKSPPYIPMLKENNVRKGFLRDDQYESLARETGQVGLWLRAMFEVAYSYGWRKSELLKMRVEQIDLGRRLIYLNPGETKSDEARSVYMTGKVFELVSACVQGKSLSDYVFTRDKDSLGRKTKLGGRIADMKDAWQEACKRAGVPELLFHDLRRNGVSNMVEAGIDEKTAMTISGHKTRAVFDRYHIVPPQALKQAAEKMERAAKERERQTRFSQAQLFEVKKPAKAV